MELFAKDDILPPELRFLPYDVNSVTHFSYREYSKNGHRTIIFKDSTVKQNRISLTETDVRKIEIVYGQECTARDRQEKLELCQSYPGVARKKRAADGYAVDNQAHSTKPIEIKKRNVDIDISVSKSLRVNPDITPPPEIRSEDMTTVLKELGINDEVQDIVDQVFKVSSLALKNAREKYCNNYSDVSPPTMLHKKAASYSGILGIVEVVGDFTKTMVDNALKNITRLCGDPEAIYITRDNGCLGNGKEPQCRNFYKSTKSGAAHYSTNHNPLIEQSTRHYGGDKSDVQYKRARNATAEGEAISVRKKRELEFMTEKPAIKGEINETGKAVPKAEDEKLKGKTEENKKQLSEMDQKLALEAKTHSENKNKGSNAKKENVEKTKESANTQQQVVETKKEAIEHTKVIESKENTHQLKLDTDDIEAITKEKVKITNKDSTNRRMALKRRSHGHHRAKKDKSSVELDNLDSILAKKIIEKKHHLAKHERYPRDKDIEDTRHKIREMTQQHKKRKPNKHLITPEEDYAKVADYDKTSEEEEAKHVKINKVVKSIPLVKKKIRHEERNMEENAFTASENKETEEQEDREVKRPRLAHKSVRPKSSLQASRLPKIVPLSKKNEDFYSDRRWPDGEVVYMIQVDTTYDLEDMGQRLAEVKNILKEKTCVNLKEIKPGEGNKYEDYIVIDNSPDYVTGRVGGRQKFGSIELFRGGQHRQHAAMMVMAMLGFYFEVSRHDRDKFIRVHMRHVRPDKLHHFEMIRSDATLPLPYDYASATHPAWQFWRQMGRTGISTVATFKETDPDGSIMKSLGQNDNLLSDIDIVKINSVYGIECFKKAKKPRQRKRKVLVKN